MLPRFLLPVLLMIPGLGFRVGMAQDDPPPHVLGSPARIESETERLMQMFLKADERNLNDGSLEWAVEFMRRHPNLNLSLFTKDRTEASQVSELIESSRRALTEIESKPGLTRAEIAKEKQSLIDSTQQRLFELIDLTQIAKIRQLNIAETGLPKLLTKTPIGEAIGLTDDQRRDIEQRAKDLAKELQDEIAQWKKKALDEIKGELTAAQRDELEKLFAADELDEIFRQVNIESLAIQYSYQAHTIAGADPERSFDLNDPDVMREKIREIVKKKHEKALEEQNRKN